MEPQHLGQNKILPAQSLLSALLITTCLLLLRGNTWESYTVYFLCVACFCLMLYWSYLITVINCTTTSNLFIHSCGGWHLCYLEFFWLYDYIAMNRILNSLLSLCFTYACISIYYVVTTCTYWIKCIYIYTYICNILFWIYNAECIYSALL